MSCVGPRCSGSGLRQVIGALSLMVLSAVSGGCGCVNGFAISTTVLLVSAGEAVEILGLSPRGEVMTLEEWDPETAQMFRDWLNPSTDPEGTLLPDGTLLKVTVDSRGRIEEIVRGDVLIFQVFESSDRRTRIAVEDRNRDGIADFEAYTEVKNLGERRVQYFDDDKDGVFDRAVIWDTTSGVWSGSITNSTTVGSMSSSKS